MEKRIGANLTNKKYFTQAEKFNSKFKKIVFTQAEKLNQLSHLIPKENTTKQPEMF